MSKDRRTQGEDFLRNHLRADIKEGARRFASFKVTNYAYTSDAAFHDYDRHIDYTYSKDIHLPPESYDHLLEVLGHFVENDIRYDYGRFQERVIENLHNEREIREQNKAVNAAYEKYRLLLDMARNGKPVED